jgi:hypothetical protein
VETTGNSSVATGGNRLSFFRAGFAGWTLDIEKAGSYEPFASNTGRPAPLALPISRILPSRMTRRRHPV